MVIAGAGVTAFFVFRPRHQELLPQEFAELPEKPKLIDEFHHNTEIYSVAFSPADPSLIASVDENGTIKLWDRNNTKEPVKILSYPGIFAIIGFSSIGELLASGGSGKLILWDVATGMEINTLETSRVFAFSPNGQQLATVRDVHQLTVKNGVQLWDIRNPKKITEIASLPFDEAHRAKSSACAVDISSDGKWIAAGNFNGTVNVWDLQTRQLVKSLETSLYSMDYLKFSPNNKYMACGGHELDMYSTASVKGFIMWELSSWQRKGEVLRGHIENLVFSPDGKMCVSPNNRTIHGRGVEIWSTVNGAPITFLRTEARDVSFSQDGNILATGGHDGILRLWELTPQQLELATTPDDVVRLIYLLREDKELPSNITTKLDKSIRQVQEFYAKEMERHGFGRKTFTFETDENGNAKVYLVKENITETLNLPNDIWIIVSDDLLDFWAVPSTRIVGDGDTFRYPTKDRGKGNIRGIEIEGSPHGKLVYASASKKELDWRVTAYGLKHAFTALGREHISFWYKRQPTGFKRFFSRVNSLTPWGKNWVKLSRCEAEWLDKSRFFNPNQPFFDSRPVIEMSVSEQAATNSRRFQFEVADEDGMHQAQLFVPRDVKDQWKAEKFYDCQALNGKDKAAVVFEITDPEVKIVILRMIDMHGNIASREFRIMEKTPEPSEKP